MNKIIKILYLLSCVIILNCNNNNDSEKLKNTISNSTNEKLKPILNENNLTKQIFLIDTQKNYSLITKSGVVVQIAKGSLQSDKNPVEIEIQEAINIKDILLAGLQTKSNGEIVSSGGMINIAAKEGYNVSIKQKLKIFVPTSNYNNEMQLYDGEKDSTGNINWVNPKQLVENKSKKNITIGKQLFIINCKNCHAINTDTKAPALWNVQNRRPKKWLYNFTKNSASIISQNHKEDSIINLRKFDFWYSNKYDFYTSCLFTKWKKIAMTPFPNLKENELDAIYTYIKTESDKTPELKSRFGITNCDSCEMYNKALKFQKSLLTKELEEQNKLYSIVDTLRLNENKLKVDKQNNIKSLFQNKANIKTVANSPVVNSLPRVTAQTTNYISPELTTGTYYELEISTFGWKNIDVLYENVDGVLKSQLFVQIQESTNYKVSVQLLIPSLKISLAGGRIKDNTFAFKTTDGWINLPQNASCYIVAIAEKEQKLFFNYKQFNASTKQTINVALKETTTEGINETLNGLKFEDIKSNIKKYKNYDNIVNLEKEVKIFNYRIAQKDSLIKGLNNQIKMLDVIKPKTCKCINLIFDENEWGEIKGEYN